MIFKSYSNIFLKEHLFIKNVFRFLNVRSLLKQILTTPASNTVEGHLGKIPFSARQAGGYPSSQSTSLVTP